MKIFNFLTSVLQKIWENHLCYKNQVFFFKSPTSLFSLHSSPQGKFPDSAWSNPFTQEESTGDDSW